MRSNLDCVSLVLQLLIIKSEEVYNSSCLSNVATGIFLKDTMACKSNNSCPISANDPINNPITNNITGNTSQSVVEGILVAGEVQDVLDQKQDEEAHNVHAK